MGKPISKTLEYKRNAMKKLRFRGRDGWRSKKRAGYNSKYYALTANAYNGGQEWTLTDINKIFKRDKTDMELSKGIGRSVAAIQIQRTRELKRRYNETLIF